MAVANDDPLSVIGTVSIRKQSAHAVLWCNFGVVFGALRTTTF